MTNSTKRFGLSQVVQVQFDDLDLYGAVHHAKVPVLVERAVFACLGGLGYPMGHPDMIALVGELSVRYSAPIAGIGPVDVRLWVERLGTSSMVTGFAVSRGDDTLATGTRTMIKIDPRTRTAEPWTNDFSRTLRDAGAIREAAEGRGQWES
jgi:acyl-CoA thioesterase FadM